MKLYGYVFQDHKLKTVEFNVKEKKTRYQREDGKYFFEWRSYVNKNSIRKLCITYKSYYMYSLSESDSDVETFKRLVAENIKKDIDEQEKRVMKLKEYLEKLDTAVLDKAELRD